MSEILARRLAGKSLQVVRAGAMAGALLISNLGAAQAQVTPQSVDAFKHFGDSLHALLSDSAAHKEFCTPGLALPGGSLSCGGGGKSANCLPFRPTGMVAPPNLGFGEVLLVAGIFCCDTTSMLTAPPNLVEGDRVLVAADDACEDD